MGQSIIIHLSLHHMLLMARIFSAGAAPQVPYQHGEGHEDEEYPEYGENHDQGIVGVFVKTPKICEQAVSKLVASC